MAEQKRRFFWRLVLPALGFLGLITLLPVLYLVVTSLTPLTLTNPSSASDFSKPLANYGLLLSDTRLRESLWTQAKLSFFTVGLQLVLGLWAATVVHARPLTGEVIRTAFLIPMVLPPIVVAIIWKVLYSPDISPFWWLFTAFGLSVPSPITDARMALGAIILADTWEWFPFTMLIILAALKLMPDEWIEAALVDGATEWQTFRYITLPYLKGSLLVAGLFRLIDSIKAFPLIYILTDGGPGTVTEITNYYTFVQAFNFSYIGYSSAITVCLVALVAVERRAKVGHLRG
ncbi:carbohydrate ABC transporter permease [Shumkonia mesophila]|uniref:carbohydrate ABC transporter permease n=1 Tax=Shumkonia mesophila TaxID=2838854 RepID=UPI002934B798|nr:sugar ABC transporter permease [Shumkonia mesophila]